MQSAHILGIALPFTQSALEAGQIEVVRAHQLASGYIRPLAFLGAEKMGAPRNAWPGDPRAPEKFFRLRRRQRSRARGVADLCGQGVNHQSRGHHQQQRLDTE